MENMQGELFDHALACAGAGCDSGNAKRGKAPAALLGGVLGFTYNGAAVRVVMQDGEPWFVGKDICKLLRYKNETDAMNRHCKGVVKCYPLPTAGGVQSVRVINEPDVMRLICGSKLPAAVQFERWVFEEVLPSIRKTGGYIAAKPEDPPEVIMARALIVADATIKQYKSKIDAMCVELADQATAIETMAPKAALADDFLISKGNILVRDFAKHIKSALHLKSWGEKKMFAWFKSRGYMNINRYPSQVAMKLGVLDVREGVHFEGLEQVMHHVTRVNAKGQDYFLKKLREEKEMGVLEVGID